MYIYIYIYISAGPFRGHQAAEELACLPVHLLIACLQVPHHLYLEGYWPSVYWYLVRTRRDLLTSTWAVTSPPGLPICQSALLRTCVISPLARQKHGLGMGNRQAI